MLEATSHRLACSGRRKTLRSEVSQTTARISPAITLIPLLPRMPTSSSTSNMETSLLLWSRDSAWYIAHVKSSTIVPIAPVDNVEAIFLWGLHKFPTSRASDRPATAQPRRDFHFADHKLSHVNQPCTVTLRRYSGLR